MYLVCNHSPTDLALNRVLHLRVAKAVQDGEENTLEHEKRTLLIHAYIREHRQGKNLSGVNLNPLRLLWDSMKCFVHLR